MTTYNTGNPLGSSAAKDLYDNAQNMDFAVNDITNAIWLDRFGRSRKTWRGIEQDAANAIAGFGYITLDSFEDGATITLPNQVLRWKSNGEYYRWDGLYPKVVPSSSTPDTTGGVSIGAWLSVGDATLRSNLRSTADGMGDALIGSKQPFSGSIARTLHDKNAEILSPGDFSSADNLIQAVVDSGLKSTIFNSTNTFTINVGSSGHVSTLTDALECAVRMRPLWKAGNSHCVIHLMAGFVLNEQLAYDGSYDFSWVKITSADAIVYASTGGFTESVTTYYEYKYLFYFKGQARSPVFAIQIEENRAGSDVCAFVVTEGAQINFAPHSGARKFYVGVHASYGAQVNGLHNGFSPSSEDIPDGYYLCDFSYSIKTALEAFVSVKVNLPLSLFEYNQDATANPALFAVYGCWLNLFASSASHSNYTGWVIRDGCWANLRYHKTINCAMYGLHCIHSVSIDARNHNTNETDPATSGKVTDSSAVLGFNGCNIAIRCESASIVESAGTDFRNCNTAINADGSANVSAKACDFSNCGLVVDASAGATISLPRFYGTSVGKLCILSEGCLLAIWNLNVTRNTTSTETRFIDTRYSSDVSIYNCIKLDSTIGLFATDNSRLSISGGTLKVPAVRSFEGAHVTLSTITFDITYVTSAVKQLIISAGGTISAVTCTNSDSTALTTSITKNTLSTSGAGYILCS